ncbi:hypothetical protein IWQ57_000030 [Coemansia nantahalensis]|uniref:Uncharacterized protein n=1 Tax=Coemansia nantahalensis TaxID=2789366 RepID=A0ACC1K8T9_9FUNG|nr:hypothetical protein IWQ57_000030 [Coemansia nantahalensis]
MLYSREDVVLSAGAVVFGAAGDCVLAVVDTRASPHTVSFPKGRIEPGERPEDAACREVEEEAGVVCRLWPDGLAGVETRYSEAIGKTKLVFWYAASLVEVTQQRLEDHEKFRPVWIGVADAEAQLTFKNDWDLLRAALRLRAGAAASEKLRE